MSICGNGYDCVPFNEPTIPHHNLSGAIVWDKGDMQMRPGSAASGTMLAASPRPLINSPSRFLWE